MVQGPREVAALLLRRRASNPGMRTRWRRAPLYHHQCVERMEAGGGHGPVPAGPGGPAQAAAQLGRAGHELRPEPTADRHAEERRPVGHFGGSDHGGVAVDLRRGPASFGPGQPHAKARPSSQRHVHLWSGFVGRGRGIRRGRRGILCRGRSAGEDEARAKARGPRFQHLHCFGTHRAPGSQRDRLQLG